jgi:methylated-DNA-[protein]-cysteine S-methyltransferase|tara:strand:- start:4029 stop:4328 length:300 start_codon:yes stop_codon:yes gene_type:complete
LIIEKKIYRKLLQVPSGKITTYKELARSVGLQNGQRVIGQIMKKNPFPVIIPCHRVVKSNGEIGGYAYGISIKKNMLVKEGISISNNKIKNFQKTIFRF